MTRYFRCLLYVGAAFLVGCAQPKSSIPFFQIGIDENNNAVISYDGPGKLDRLAISSKTYSPNKSGFLFLAASSPQDAYIVGSGYFLFKDNHDDIRLELKVLSPTKIEFLHYAPTSMEGLYCTKIALGSASIDPIQAKPMDSKNYDLNHLVFQPGQYALTIHGRFTEEYVNSSP